ncbi:MULTISPECIES: hypothetical protein [unclassified Tolypothrix]|uniref:hypothetical protein n=1 Tax=unclassified Tolypothrix TaxID=2649714 RepID=UPI0005EAA2E5|nr:MULTISPECIES: hypothetical protein [unclassified Tolypothrix]BAY88467.1 hypothetical protein NIES3275_04420 [Microchaete diplosiphon NIES-3275]EKF02149.1 hypothetical protein FDUTEX481_06872 [Tolypothrix sp. PCC 7601]MBE9081118.1 hypothetical protein [Tolypothrix sp. LEGE 11397]UYD29147.1 hypothetical protein HGR01_14560 [Tolypothrix sp. PCC 7712]UYD34940.1 hypothetical protein HG267_03775 [Tolypothrix sp. PCC 7601]
MADIADAIATLIFDERLLDISIFNNWVLGMGHWALGMGKYQYQKNKHRRNGVHRCLWVIRVNESGFFADFYQNYLKKVNLNDSPSGCCLN